MNTSTVCKSVAIAALTVGGLLAHAAEALDGPPPGWSGPPPGWSGGVLGGAARLPDFEGSRTSRHQPVLGFAITYRAQALGSVEMGSRGLNWTFVQRPEVDVGVGLSLDPGRLDNGERKLTAVGYRPGSERLSGMGEIGVAPVFSLSGALKLGRVPLGLAVKRATGRQDGTQVDLGVSVPWKFHRHGELSLAGTLGWADRRYMQTFFGVSAAQAAAARRAEFEAGSGWKSAQLALALDMAFSRHWHLNASVQARRLLRDAAHSPLTEKTTQPSLLLGALYQFQL